MTRAAEEHSDENGRSATTPSEIPAKGWKDILYRIWNSLSENRILLLAGGVTFYLLLALFPALVVFVSAYGFLSDPASVSGHISTLSTVVPSGGLDIIKERLESLATQATTTLGIGVAFGLLVAFWSANNGVKALFEALNVAYAEQEKRSFIVLNLFSFAMTLGAMAMAAMLFAAIGVIPAALALMRLDASSEMLLSFARWPVLLAFIAAGISLLYRYGPSREPAKWRWISWGCAFTTIAWIAMSAGFSHYLQRFANYEATYGSLGAVIGFMMWTWISVVIVIIGAMLNAEMEHQTAVDTTSGAPLPMGQRGAVMADNLGKSADDSETASS